MVVNSAYGQGHLLGYRRPAEPPFPGRGHRCAYKSYLLADANSHALANQAVQNRALPVVATQVAFGNDQSRRQAFARQCFERRMNRVATPKRLACYDDAIASAGIS